MKTKISIYITLVFLSIVSTSCSDDFLVEKKQYGQYDDTFYESQERVDWYINQLYYNYFSAYRSPLSSLVGAYNSDRSRLTEELGGVNDFTNPTLTIINPDNAAGFTGYYGTRLESKVKNEPYHRIRDCNSLIAEIDTKGAGLDEAYRNTAKGQAYYFRALQYFDLMRVYGGVPLVTSIQEATSTNPATQLPRASVTNVVEQIVSDLDMAASLLPGNWGAADYGRFTKGAAMAQKARVLLTYASPLFNKDWDTSNERWEASLQAGLAAEIQLESDGYGLFGSTAQDWENMFLVNNTFCREAITVQLLGNGNTNVALNNSWERSIRLVSQGGGGAMAAPKEMIDLFPMADGSRPTASNGYDDFLFFVDRDPRFYRTFAYSGSKWGYKEDTSSTVWAYRWLGLVNSTTETAFFSDNNQESSPAFIRKMSNQTATNESAFQYSGTDIFEYRYAELLLNIAESYAAKGDIPNAIAYIGKVRNRVGITSTNNYGLGVLSDKYSAIEACLYERRVELAYEGKRFWDTQRWMLYNDDSSVNNSTCAKLGIAPINGTQRTGNFLQYNTLVTSEDPLEDSRVGITVDPDSANFEMQIQNLASFYTANFVLEDLPSAMDNVNGTAVQIDWKQNYYIMGLQTSTLTQNTWLDQTIGWTDASGSSLGNFNYQD